MDSVGVVRAAEQARERLCTAGTRGLFTLKDQCAAAFAEDEAVARQIEREAVSGGGERLDLIETLDERRRDGGFAITTTASAMPPFSSRLASVTASPPDEQAVETVMLGPVM